MREGKQLHGNLSSLCVCVVGSVVALCSEFLWSLKVVFGQFCGSSDLKQSSHVFKRGNVSGIEADS